MSAWIVEMNTIHNIVAGLERAEFCLPDYPSLRGMPVIIRVPNTRMSASLGKLLWVMNYRAVKKRYPDTENNAKSDRPIPGPYSNGHTLDLYEYKNRVAPAPGALLKHLDCYLYQCFEGDIPNSDLYTALEQFVQVIEAFVARKDEDYIKTIWA